jgi:hypothetical protein
LKAPVEAGRDLLLQVSRIPLMRVGRQQQSLESIELLHILGYGINES